jgi:WD40 repeat protein
MPVSEAIFYAEVYQINWSPDGTKLALASNSIDPAGVYTQTHNLNIYDSVTGDLMLELDTRGEFAVDWSPDGDQLLTGGEGGMVRVWDAQSGEVLREMVSHNSTDWEIIPGIKDHVIATRFSPDGTQAASLSFGGSAHIWDVATEEKLMTLEHPPVYVTDQFYWGGTHKVALAWSPDGDQLATAWYDGVARIWDLDTGEISQVLVGHTSNLIGVDWSPDGVFILTQGRDSTARLWAESSGQMVLKLPAAGCGNAAWSKDGRWIAVPTQTGLLAWDTSVLPPVLNPSTPVELIWEGLWTPDGKSVVLSGNPAMVFDWAGDKIGRQIGSYNLFFAISPDSTRVVAADASDAKKAQVIDLYTGEVLSELKSPISDHPNSQWACNSWSNNGTMVASASYPVYLTVIWDPETGEELARSETVDGLMFRPQFSPDDSLLAAPLIFAEGNSPVYLIDTATGETLRELPSEDGWSDVAMWSPDGKTLAVGYQSGVIKLWDTQTWKVNRIFDAHQSQVWDLNWSPDGKRILSAELVNGVAHIWEAATGEIVATWDMKGLIVGGLNDVDWSPDGQYILLHGEEGLPFIRRVWQSTEELIDYAYECCVWRELTPAERQQFGLPEKP